MSKFHTSIPVDVDLIKQFLPDGAFVNDVFFNEKEKRVEVRWEHDQFKTPFDFETEFPLDNLQKQQLPERVQLVSTSRPTRLPLPAVVEPENPPAIEAAPVLVPDPTADVTTGDAEAVAEQLPEVAESEAPAEATAEKPVPTAKGKSAASKKK